MSPDRWRQIEEVFHQAVRLEAGDRAGFLRRACGCDADLAREVEELLKHADPEDDFLESSAVEHFANGKPAGGGPEKIGHYCILRPIGDGGMGAVYLAARADDEYRKEVAIKLIRRGLDLDSVVRRFRHERQILANLDHPNIARLLDGGTTEDRLPYIVMEYVAGESIDVYCRDRHLSIRERLRLFRVVCSAVHYAHQHLVVHLDIKPANILVTVQGVPKLLDFGIARLLDPEAGVRAGDTGGLPRPMTPDYASPEQIRGEPATVASDIYSLGVLLHELLSGERPCRIGRRQTEPGRPGARKSEQVGEDLGNIVAMATRADPQRRYASVAQFSDDIGRYLGGLPVMARRDTRYYRTGKFLRRHKAGVAAAAMLVAVLLGGLISTAWQAKIAARQRARAEAAQARAERRLDDFLKLTHSLLFDYYDGIAGLSGSTAVRLRLVRDTIDYLDEMAREAGDSAPLQRQLAAAYLKIGDVQGRPYAANLGDTAGALFSYRRAVSLLMPLSAADPNDERLRLELSDAYEAVGRLLTRMLDYTGAIESLRNALAIRKQLATAHPGNTDYRKKLASIWLALGDPLLYSLDYREAIDAYLRAEEIWRPLCEANPVDLPARREWAVSVQRVGAVYEDSASFLSDGLADAADARKDWEKALDRYREAMAIARKLVENDPYNAQFRRTFADMGADTATALERLGDTRKALELQRKSLQIFTDLARSDSANQESQFDLLDAKRGLAEIEAKSGRPEAAIAAYRESIAAGMRLAEVDPSDKEIRAYLTGTYGFLSTLVISKGDLSAGLGFARARLRLDADSASLYGQELPWRSYCAMDLMKIAKILAMSGRPAEARAFSIRALADAKRNAGRPDAAALDLLTYGELLLTASAKELRNPAEAVAYLEQAARKRPGGDLDVSRMLAIAYYSTGSREKAVAAAASAVAALPYPPEAREPAILRRGLEKLAVGFSN